MNDAGSWGRRFRDVADQVEQNGCPAAVVELLRFAAEFEDADGVVRDPDLDGFAYRAGDLTDREVAIAFGIFSTERDEHDEGGQLACAELIGLLVDALLDECSGRGITWDSAV